MDKKKQFSTVSFCIGILIGLLIAIVIVIGNSIQHESTLEKGRKLNTRVAAGHYYDYLVVQTDDGNEWLLDESTDFLRYDKEQDRYMAIFKNGERVSVLFDTLGTESIKDDVIIKVKSLENKGE